MIYKTMRGKQSFPGGNAPYGHRQAMAVARAHVETPGATTTELPEPLSNNAKRRAGHGRYHAGTNNHTNNTTSSRNNNLQVVG
jgi:hypothetical protein